MAAQAPPLVSIVMPCLNEAETVGICVDKAQTWLAESGVHGEVVVVDNGSTDHSPDIAAQAGARVVHEAKRGYGNAYLRGFAEARGQYLVMGDADDTYDFSDLTPLIAPLDEGYDLVVANRFKGGIKPGAMPWAHRYIGSPIINFLIRLFIGVKIGDSQSGFRAFTRKGYRRLQMKSGGMEFASEMIVKAARQGLQITEIAAPYHPRVGESKLNTIRDGWRHLRFLLIAAPDYLFTVPGLALLTLGIATLVLSFTSPAGVEIGSLTWQPVFAGAILSAIGANALAFGVISKTYAVSKRLLKEDAWTRLYRRYFKLEIVLALGAVLVGLGIATDLWLFSIWASEARVAMGLQLAAVAQCLLIVGADLGLAGFLMVLVSDTR